MPTTVDSGFPFFYRLSAPRHALIDRTRPCEPRACLHYAFPSLSASSAPETACDGGQHMLGQLGAIQRYYDGSEGASPSGFASSEALTSGRGLVVLRNTFSATLPSSDRLISERPCDGHADKRFFIRRRFFDEDLSRYTLLYRAPDGDAGKCLGDSFRGISRSFSCCLLSGFRRNGLSQRRCGSLFRQCRRRREALGGFNPSARASIG